MNEAYGEVPTSYGKIAVSWKIPYNKSDSYIRLTIPDGIYAVMEYNSSSF